MRQFARYAPSLIALLMAIGTLLLGPEIVRRFTHARTLADVRVARAELEQSDILVRFNDAVRNIARAVEPCVVHVNVVRRHAQSGDYLISEESTGSGWIYDDAGHIVTNQHVVNHAETIEVRYYDGTHRQATLIGADERTDIAVIRPVGAAPVIAAKRATDRPLNQGDLVFAFGSPFGFEFSMSSGVVSGQGRQTRSVGAGYENYIQTDAEIHPGNSGGPLTNVIGEVVGMNTATAVAPGQIDTSGTSGRTGSVGLAIPLDIIEFVVDQIIKTGEVRNGGLGVELSELTPLWRRELNGYDSSGVVVQAILPGMPAESAGMKVGDVIVRVNGETVNSISQLRSIVHTQAPGSMIELEIWRDSIAFPLQIELTEWNHAWDNGRPIEPGR